MGEDTVVLMAHMGDSAVSMREMLESHPNREYVNYILSDGFCIDQG